MSRDPSSSSCIETEALQHGCRFFARMIGSYGLGSNRHSSLSFFEIIFLIFSVYFLRRFDLCLCTCTREIEKKNERTREREKQENVLVISIFYFLTV
jgi:hypothetical protein